jgi:cadmium resistance protein CadD (predicted permease)
LLVRENTLEEQVGTRKNKVLAVAGVRIANGGDNIGIYIPLFATLSWLNQFVRIGIFLTMTFSGVSLQAI